MDLFAVCPPGLEAMLATELRGLGFTVRETAGGVELRGGMEAVARLNVCSRLASRILVRLGQFRATAFAELVRKATALPWERHVAPGTPVALRVTCKKSRLYHSDAVAERLHKAIEARIGGPAPVATTDEDDPGDVQLFVARLEGDVCTVSADTSGALLHQRGYRLQPGAAPLRETLAAALLLGSRWDPATPLCDPMCGSGTLVIEGALIAMRRAPGLKRRFAFERWPGGDPGVLARVRDEARAQERTLAMTIEAADLDDRAATAARENAARAEIDLEVAVRPLWDLPARRGPGLIAVNPPYGLRLGDAATVPALWRELGVITRGRRPEWSVAAVSPDEAIAREAGLRWEKLARTFNGGLRVDLLRA